MPPEHPSYLLEQQYPYPSLCRSIWSAYGTYRSLDRALSKAAALVGPCRITECRIVWRSVSIAKGPWQP